MIYHYHKYGRGMHQANEDEDETMMPIQWLKDLNLGSKIALTVVIVIGVLLVLALYGYLTGAWDVPIDAT